MTSIDSLTLLAPDPDAVTPFYRDALGLGALVTVRESHAATSGFRAFTVSLLVSQPAAVRRLVDAALAAGATSIKPAEKSIWGFGGVVRSPDGSIWKVATSAKKDTAPDTGRIEQVVLLLGAADVTASKQFYVERGLAVGKSFLGRYVQFEMPSSPVALALYRHRALAKDAGVPPQGTGSHRLLIGSDTPPFTDPDGFAWQTVDARTREVQPAAR